MVTENKEKKKKPVVLRILELLATLASLAVICWIGNDCYRHHERTAALLREANATLKKDNMGAVAGTREALLAAQSRLAEGERTPPGLVMAYLRDDPAPSLRRQLATIYRNIGNRHYEKQQSHLAVRAYATALAYDPRMDGVVTTLVQECYYTKDWDLGLLACKLCGKEEKAKLAKLRKLLVKQRDESR